MRIVFIISIIIISVVVYLLITASPLLEYELISNPVVPLGNILTWAGIITIPLSIFTGVLNLRKPETTFNKVLKYLLLFSLFLAILWMPVSYFLADNWSANFEAQGGFRGGIRAASYFWNYTYFVTGLPLLILLSYLLSRIIILIR